MKLAAIKSLPASQNNEVRSLQSGLSSLYTQLQLNPLLKGNLVSKMKDNTGKEVDIVLGPSVVAVPHGLTIAATGYLVIWQNAPATIYKYTPPQPHKRERQRKESAHIQ